VVLFPVESLGMRIPDDPRGLYAAYGRLRKELP
jgi:hypothetical protein